jgi:hypothetical protein
MNGVGAIGYVLAWKPFLQPLPGVWHNAVWPLLMLPLCAAVAIVYKSIKCNSMRDVPKQAFEITLWIVLGMAFAATLLAGLVTGVEAWQR